FISNVSVYYNVGGGYSDCKPFSIGNWIVSAIEKRLKNHFPDITVKADCGSSYATLIVSEIFDVNTIADSLE
ncbi:16050_t:CDS:2, partial [Racocetra persica]